MNKVECSVIIVNWNVKDLVVKTVEAALNQTDVNLEVIVVDNNSSDESVKALQDKFANKIKLIASNTNLGFAKANNKAVAVANGEYLLILNPDCFLNEHSLSLALKRYKQNDCGVLGFRLFNADGSQQLSIRNFPDLISILLFCFRINHWPKLFSYFSNYFQLNFNYNKEQFVEQVMGACFLIKTELFKKLNGFDEKFYIWFEEVDLCKRVTNLGYKNLYFPEAQAIHVGGQSFNQANNCRKSKIFYNSLLYYSQKHFSNNLKPLLFVSCKLSIVFGCIISLWKKKS